MTVEKYLLFIGVVLCILVYILEKILKILRDIHHVLANLSHQPIGDQIRKIVLYSKKSTLHIERIREIVYFIADKKRQDNERI